jgi:transketolase C-terminal domain/subunit
MQNQIGAFPGFTVVHVYRVLRSLRDERIVNLEKHRVTIGLGDAVAGDAT